MTGLPDPKDMPIISLETFHRDMDLYVDRAEAGEFFIIAGGKCPLILMPYSVYEEMQDPVIDTSAAID